MRWHTLLLAGLGLGRHATAQDSTSSSTFIMPVNITELPPMPTAMPDNNLTAPPLPTYNGAFFSLYPDVNSTMLAHVLNISIDCLEALNTSLPCDPTLLQMVSDIDNYWWEPENLTELCTRDCFGAVSLWNDNVELSCQGDFLPSFNKYTPADVVAGPFYDGMHLACLTNENSTTEVDAVWCVIESQTWVGDDVLGNNATTPSTTAPNPTAPGPRLATIYGDDVLCSECFTQLLYSRLSAHFRPPELAGAQLDYLVAQYQDVLDICNYTDHMPPLVIWEQPDYTDIAPPLLSIPAPNNSTNNGSAGNPTTGDACDGQLIVKTSLDAAATCASIARAFHVPTGAVQDAMDSDDDGNCAPAAFTGDSFCLPPPCPLAPVPANATCASLAAAFSTSRLNITVVQLLTWNPYINGLCDALVADDLVCRSAPGGAYILPPPPPPSTGTGDGGHVRGGGGGNLPSGVFLTAPAGPTQTGIAADCTGYDTPVSGEGCKSFAGRHGLAPEQLYGWNPVLGDDGQHCDDEFWLGDYYCVAGPAMSSTTASSTRTTSTTTPISSSTSAAAAPGPTQDGIPATCTAFAMAVNGQSCRPFATEHHITAAQLYAWNPVLGASGENCETAFWASEYYCVGVSG